MLKESPSKIDTLIFETTSVIEDVTFKIPICEKTYVERSDCKHLPHNHAHIELYVFLDGSCKTSVPPNLYSLVPGDILIIAQREYHCWVPPDDQHNKFTAADYHIKIEIPKEPDKELNPDMLEMLKRLRTTQKLHDDSMFSIVATKKIHELANERGKGYEAAISGLVTALVVHILHLITPKDIVHNESTSNLHLRETNIESFFLTNFSKDINIDSLAESLHLCPRRVNQLLQKYFGCSFSRKLNKTRIEMAKNYLLYSRNSISDIGRLCGYNSNNYFHILFKRSTGVTPKQYRNSFGNNFKSLHYNVD